MNNTTALQTKSEFSINITHKKMQGHHSMPSNHYHSHYEIYYLISGERNYFIKDEINIIKSGDLVIVNKNDIHKTIDTGVPHHERILIDFEEDFLSIYSKEEMEYLLSCFKINRPVIQLKASEQIIVKDLLNKMQQEQWLKEPGYIISLRAKLTELLIFTNRLIQKMDQSINDVDESTAIQKRISKVVQYINSFYGNSLSLFAVANTFYISPYYLSRLFKEVTGFNFVEYVNLVRIREAEKLLESSNMKIIEISHIVGFDSVAHFGRVFKSITSLSPSSYRKQYKNNKRD